MTFHMVWKLRRNDTGLDNINSNRVDLITHFSQNCARVQPKWSVKSVLATGVPEPVDIFPFHKNGMSRSWKAMRFGFCEGGVKPQFARCHLPYFSFKHKGVLQLLPVNLG